MAYLLDTNTLIHARDGTPSVLAKMDEHDGNIVTSALCFAELQRGLHKRVEHFALRQARLQVLLPRIPIIHFDAAAARAYGDIIAQCGWAKGRDFDRMIAAHAISTRSILVTNNAADFRDVPNLSLESWATA